MKVMIFAAGLGTRLRPLTDHKPKALVEINGTPMLELLILKLKKFGFNDFVINIHHFSDQIVQFLKEKNNFNSDIAISDETDELLDTGGGILKAKDLLKSSGRFLIYNADIFCDINPGELIEYHDKHDALATLSVRNAKSNRKLIFDSNNFLCRWENNMTNEIKTARMPIGQVSAFAFNGIHVLNESIFDMITETGKFSIIDLYLRLAENNKISAFESPFTHWYDLGKPENIEQVSCFLAQNKYDTP